MSDKMRWRYRDTNQVVAAVDSSTVIEIGDLLYQATDDARPASDQADQGSETVNQELFVDNFLGVAMQRSRNGDTSLIRVATTGIFEFDVLAGECFELGDMVELSSWDGSGHRKLQNQQVTKTNSPHCAIGRAARREPNPITTVLVAVVSTVMVGGTMPR